MMRALWIAKTGMEAQQLQMDTVSNNLANVGTTGYKRAHAVFEDLMYQNLRQSGANSSEQSTLPTGLQVGLGSRAVATARNFSQGTLQQTNNSLDVAINGNGFFQVQMPDGSTAYSRDGSFKTDANGQLVTNNGYVIAPGITVPPNTQSITVAPDGVVTAQVPGNAQPVQLGNLQLAGFPNPGGLEPRGQNLFVETAASGAPTPGNPGGEGLGLLQQGYVETSNVNVVEELVAMIQTQRAYELNSKAIQTTDQMLQRLSQM
jgi:flagellar basal-body rod protein FlgG